MRKTILLSLALCVLSAPAFAANYPVSGAWGESKTTGKDKVDCRKVRVIDFKGEQRTDTGGGVPAYRNVSVTAEGKNFRIVDAFTTGQIRNGKVTYTLRKVADDRIELDLRPGNVLKLQRCK